MLILFDIDLTLITTGGCGIRAMTLAGRELFGDRFTSEGVSYAGRLDPLIIGEMFAASGVEDTPERRAALRGLYTRRLQELLAASEVKRVLPGVPGLLERLRARRVRGDDLTLGVLTGNFEATGSMKLRACGIDPDQFEVRAWGDASPHDPPSRDHLVPVAMEGFREVRGRAIEPSRVVVVGDTEHDVRCAKANGCRSLAVATGRTSLESLIAAGADRAVPDLSEVAAIEAWLTATVD